MDCAVAFTCGVIEMNWLHVVLRGLGAKFSLCALEGI